MNKNGGLPTALGATVVEFNRGQSFTMMIIHVLPFISFMYHVDWLADTDLHPKTKSHLIMVYDIFTCWIQFANSLLWRKLLC